MGASPPDLAPGPGGVWSLRADVKWVYDSLASYQEALDADRGAEWLRKNRGTAPGPGAISLLVWAGDGNSGEFFKSVWSKLIPTRGQLDESERFEDDGREVDDLIVKVLADAGDDEW